MARLERHAAVRWNERSPLTQLHTWSNTHNTDGRQVQTQMAAFVRICRNATTRTADLIYFFYLKQKGKCNWKQQYVSFWCQCPKNTVWAAHAFTPCTNISLLKNYCYYWIYWKLVWYWDAMIFGLVVGLWMNCELFWWSIRVIFGKKKKKENKKSKFSNSSFLKVNVSWFISFGKHWSIFFMIFWPNNRLIHWENNR